LLKDRSYQPVTEIGANKKESRRVGSIAERVAWCARLVSPEVLVAGTRWCGKCQKKEPENPRRPRAGKFQIGVTGGLPPDEFRGFSLAIAPATPHSVRMSQLGTCIPSLHVFGT